MEEAANRPSVFYPVAQGHKSLTWVSAKSLTL